jgi:hypothetical protein
VRAYVRSDDEVAATIQDDLILHTLWLDPALCSVAVKDGVAPITGRVEQPSMAQTIEHSVRLVPGIVDVHASVAWWLDDGTLAPPRSIRSWRSALADPVGSRPVVATP